jgi:hypothetical protein
MTRSIVFRIISALVLVAVIAGIGGLAFRAGFTQGAAAEIQLPNGDPGTLAFPYYGYGWHPFAFHGFGFFGLLFGLFLFFVALGALRRLIWGSRFGWHHTRYHGWSGHMTGKPWGEGVPPIFTEWHRRAHQAPEEKKPSADEPTE